MEKTTVVYKRRPRKPLSDLPANAIEVTDNLRSRLSVLSDRDGQVFPPFLANVRMILLKFRSCLTSFCISGSRKYLFPKFQLPSMGGPRCWSMLMSICRVGSGKCYVKV